MDMLIGAIALSNELPLYTCNANDFAGLEELLVIVADRPLNHRGCARSGSRAALVPPGARKPAWTGHAGRPGPLYFGKHWPRQQE
jgi:hypothetical protein